MTYITRELERKFLKLNDFFIDKASLNRGDGGIICICQEPTPIAGDNCFIPSNLI